jgi:hypothetical protein
MPGIEGDVVLPVPGVIEGDSWRIRAAMSGVLALVVLIVLISIISGNHGGFSRNLLQGIIVTSTCFVLLAVVVPYRLWRARRLDLKRDGIVIRNFWQNWEIPWSEIIEVVVTQGGGSGRTWYTPTVRLRSGTIRKIYGLGSANDAYPAQKTAAMLAAVVDAHRS